MSKDSSFFRVKKSEKGVCLEAFLYGKYPDWTHKKIKQVIDQKRVLVNNKTVYIASWNLKGGDRVNILEGDASLDTMPEAATGRYHFVNTLYEDDYILAAVKPAFIDYDSFVSQVAAYLKRKVKGSHPYLGQMHRLDKETSGILLFTKKKIANTLADQFRNRTITKEYVAVVEGDVEKEYELIKEKLVKGQFKGGKKSRVADEDDEDALEARTEYWVKERYGKATLLFVRIGTGRTHQIRVHMSNLGYPLVGDKVYGTAEKKKAFPINRMALHAHKVEFYHPITAKKLKLTAPLPDDMNTLIDRLRMES
ncbi:RluA family pseudouridine synthase [bacterium]|nr:RluA family pseudouridine synthase [bacterium]